MLLKEGSAQQECTCYRFLSWLLAETFSFMLHVEPGRCIMVGALMIGVLLKSKNSQQDFMSVCPRSLQAGG